MTRPRRAFSDSNVLFSATFNVPNDFEALWYLPDVLMLTSEYSIGEVNRNLKTVEQRSRLWKLIDRSELVPGATHIVLEANIDLPGKDVPILQAAIAGKADFLVTGDANHFGLYFDNVIQGVLIETPAVFKSRYPEYFRRGVSK